MKNMDNRNSVAASCHRKFSLKQLLLFSLTLVLLFNTRVKSVSANKENTLTLEAEYYIDYHPYIARDEEKELVDKNSKVGTWVKWIFYLPEEIRDQSELSLFFPIYFRDRVKEVANLEKAIIKDQDGNRLNSTFSQDILSISLRPSTEELIIWHRTDVWFKKRGKVVNLYIYRDKFPKLVYPQEISKKNTFPETKSGITIYSRGSARMDNLWFASVPPTAQESIIDYLIKKEDGQAYYYSQEDLDEYFQNHRSLWLQFGDQQVYDFNINLSFKTDYKLKPAFGKLARIPVVISLPIDNTKTFIKSSSYPVAADINPTFGNKNRQLLVFLPINESSSTISIEGQFMVTPLKEEYFSYGGENDLKATINDYPDYLEELGLLIDNDYYQKDNPLIQQTAKQIMGDEQAILKIVKSTYDFVIEKIDYDYLTLNLYKDQKIVPPQKKPEQTLVDGSGICGDYSRLMISLLQAQGIPSSMLIGTVDLANSDEQLPWHAWVEVSLPKATIVVDPTWGESGRDYIFEDFEHIAFAKEKNPLLYQILGEYQDVSFDYRLTPAEEFDTSLEPLDKFAKDVFREEFILDRELPDDFFDYLSTLSNKEVFLFAKIILRNPDAILKLQENFTQVVVGVTILLLVFTLFIFLTIKIFKKIKFLFIHRRTNFLSDNLKTGLILAILSVMVMPFLGALPGGAIGIFGLIKSIKAIKEHKYLGIIGILISSFSILYLLLALFVLITALSGSPEGYYQGPISLPTSTPTPTPVPQKYY